MKKFGKLIFILCLVAVLAVTVAACNEKGEENNGGGGTLYGITMPSSDIYAIGGEVPESAAEGTTITFTVTLNDPENSAILGVTVEPTFDASYDIASNNGTYSFVMPLSHGTIRGRSPKVYRKRLRRISRSFLTMHLNLSAATRSEIRHGLIAQNSTSTHQR